MIDAHASMKSAALREAVILWQQGRPEAAVEVSAQLLEDGSVDADAVIFHSGLLLHLRRYEDARELLEQAVGQYPDHASILANLSIARRNCGLVISAVETAERALFHSPEHLGGWNALLLALLNAGRQAEAGRLLPEALSLHPDAPSLQHLRIQLKDTAEQAADGETDQLAKRLIEQARGFMATGARGQAEACYRQAIAVRPDSAPARSGLGELLLLSGRSTEAAEHLAAVLRKTPSDARAGHLYAVASGNPPPVASREYVRDLFDTMAESFDAHLRDRLAYRVPEELSERLEQRAGQNLGEVLDLGCGTGLVGECLAGRSVAVDGVDLSAEMLLKARARDCYRQLYLAEIGQFLDESEQRWQTVTAADVFIYHGKLDELLVKIHRALTPGGFFGFSVEAIAGGGFDVDPMSGRYRHSQTYLNETLQAAGLLDTRFFDTTIRNESGRPIAGWIVLARRDA